MKGNKPNAGKISKNRRKKLIYCYIFILPQLALFLAFTIYPIIMSYVYSFFNWSGYGSLSNFIGLENYAETISDPFFWNAFKNSFIFMFFVVLVQVPLALLIAILLNSSWLKGATVYRTIYFLPVVTTTAVIGIVMRFIFGAYKGLINEMLLAVGILDKPVDWLGSMDTAMMIIILVGIWKTFGMKMVYWLAALQSLPKELFEAAKVDGANWLQTFRYVMFPLLLPVGSVILLLSSVNALHVFDLVKSMTNGGPAFHTDMVDLYIYRYAFEGGGMPRAGFASAAGVVYGFAILFVSLILGIVVKKTGGKQSSH
ncbi:carbohydrate ABC transporter permease [Paenibacillus radicis (ex Xue et al. 2023)]|uniref:Sugar ABC transporter permease n=1 Tax=Paenibacillus radicis (ex Xue et al. 2023) TaxID=2972489 RepID=A0ABT1YIG6_9BACL|nr:sugar ABC transporter permease [Paenibacillus radicis (ex Xue et al. 2023)]MCR8632978.1 sugar ABC transporter permease [Paenibacillus radicis (ex Xue et al. 2023)]